MAIDPPDDDRNAVYDLLPPLQSATGTLADKLYDVLLEAIIDGTLPAGSHLKAESISRRYGVSVIPVRESLRTLQATNWVTVRPHQGAFVRQGSQEELDDLNEMRSVVEVAAAELAAKRRTDDALANLRSAVEVGDALLADPTPDAFSLANSAFHDGVAAASGNVVLRDTQRALNQRVRFYTVTLSRDRIQRSVAEHREIAEAIAAADVDLARRLAADHLKGSLQEVRGARRR